MEKAIRWGVEKAQYVGSGILFQRTSLWDKNGITLPENSSQRGRG
jgi:hypothetical protein